MAKECYVNSKKVGSIHFGVGKSNCLTYIPEDIKLELDEVISDWTQPALTSNGTMDGNAFAVNQSSILNEDSYGFKAFDKQGAGTYWHSAKGFPQSIAWYNPKPLKITNVKITNRSIDGSFPNAYQLQYSDDKNTWTTTNTGNGTSGFSASWNIAVSHTGFHKYWRLVVSSATGANSDYLAIGEIDITAQEKTSTLILKAGSKVYVPNGTSDKKYYKYTYSSWSQPTNPSGITATSGWTNISNAFDNNSSTYAQCGTTTDYIEWNLGADVCLTGITATGNYASGGSRAANLVVKSIDSSGKETTLGTTTGATSSGTYNLSVTFSEKVVNKLRFYLANNDKGESPATSVKTRIREIKLTATRKRTVTEGTASDYDYFVGAGTPIFDEVVVSSDSSIYQPYNDTRMLFIRHNSDTDKYIDGYPVGQCHSGSTAPTGSQWMFWYDTSSNILKRTSDSGATWDNYYSFPICIYTTDNGGISSINQIFNGFGYIGSHWFALPRMKALLIDKLNPNGTYKSVEFEVPRVLTHSLSSSFTRTLFINNKNGASLDAGLYYYEQTYAPNIKPNDWERWYNPNENKLYYHQSGGTSWLETEENWVAVGTGISTDGKITSLTPREIQYNNQVLEVKRVYKGSQLIWGYDPSEVIFQSSTAGTYTVNIATSGYYNVTVVGGGSGGAYVYSSKFSDGRASGGSGAGFKGVVYLSAGNHTIKIGAGGGGQAYESNGQSSATSTAGGQSSIDSIIVAGGGGSAVAKIHGATQTAGSGGTLTYDSSKVQSKTLATNGNTGTTVYGSNITGASSVLSGTTYGAGGNAGNNYTTAGGNGYVLITSV